MKYGTLIQGVLVFASALLHVTTSELSSPDWYWLWSCKSGQCVKSLSPSDGHTAMSQNGCRLTCGRYGALWPRPTGTVQLGSTVIPFSPSKLRFDLIDVAGTTQGGPGSFLTAAADNFVRYVRLECGVNCTLSSETEVVVHLSTTSSSMDLTWDTDEMYTLDVVTRGSQVSVYIRAKTVFGARHGLETLSQLIAGYTSVSSSSKLRRSFPRHGLLLVTSAHIIDKPSWPHRGLLLDTARNFLPISAIKRTIDGMASCKMNVLHWHATDSQSFPLESTRVPQLTRYGAYSSHEVYSSTDVAELTEYALIRGVHIILEIDAPAHAGNGWQWGEAAGLGELAVCVNQQPWRKYCIQPPCGQLNPVNPSMYRVLRELYRDILDLFNPGEPFHMGGDEVFFACWNSSQDIIKWMENHNMGRSQADFLQLWGDFQATALKIFDDEVGHTSTPIILWSSQLTQPGIIENYLDKDRYIIETWVEAADELPHTLLSKGYRLIMATKDAWYLDHGFWGRTVYHNWRTAYDNRLPNHSGVLGGEAAMWSELVNENSLDTKVWPRTAAVAERLWSNPASNSQDAEVRFYRHRERLTTRGINADAVIPEWCFQNEGLCR